MRLLALYLKPSVAPETGSELHWLLSKHPKVANPDGLNYLFAEVCPFAVDPILTTDFVDGEGQLLTGDALMQAVAKLLFSTDRSRAIHIPMSQARELHKHPAWALWCGKYDDSLELEADHELVFGVGVDRRKDLASLVEQSRTELKAAFGGS